MTEPSSNGKIKIQVAMIGVLGVVVGALLTYYFTSRQQRNALMEEAQREAYVHFLIVRELPFQIEDAKNRGDTLLARTLEDKWNLEGAQAVNRIAIYGTKEVVSDLA